MEPIWLIVIFAATALAGYKLIRQVPSLLHTPLMSGMNALSGVTVLGALCAAGAAVYSGSRFCAYIAIVLAMINVAGGFGVTARMLNMFKSKKEAGGE
ncbi:MAG: NAD(P) transhydrogenase subunit alpha [Firmicutes bacterium]|nr:NAD(P) transhydrogenase subunit alpha [Bacillota bacterium]